MRNGPMSTADDRPPSASTPPTWSTARTGILAGAYAGSQVGAVAALVLSLLTWFLVAVLDPTRNQVDGWVCCFFFALGAPLFFGGMAGGLAGLLGGLGHALTGRPVIGALCGLGSGVLTAGILAGVWWA